MMSSKPYLPQHSAVFMALSFLFLASLGCSPCPEQTGETSQAQAVDQPQVEAEARPPLIGITGYVIVPNPEGDSVFGNFRITRTYRDAVLRLGGHPVHLIPIPDEQVPQLLDNLDGVILAGGPDIDPAVYGEEQHPSISLVPRERQDFDLTIARLAVERRIPILGICLGSQEINVALGGSMVQDIPSEVDSDLVHRVTDVARYASPSHEVTLVEGTPLASFYDQPTINVNSLHHQSSDVLGEGLVVAATAPDGVIEGFYMPDHPFLIGVQYHPEMQNDPPGLHDNLLRAFVEAASTYRDQRGQ